MYIDYRIYIYIFYTRYYKYNCRFNARSYFERALVLLNDKKVKQIIVIVIVIKRSKKIRVFMLSMASIHNVLIIVHNNCGCKYFVRPFENVVTSSDKMA